MFLNLWSRNKLPQNIDLIFKIDVRSIVLRKSAVSLSSEFVGLGQRVQKKETTLFKLFFSDNLVFSNNQPDPYIMYVDTFPPPNWINLSHQYRINTIVNPGHE